MRNRRIVAGALRSLLPLTMLFMAGASEGIAASPGFGGRSDAVAMPLGAVVAPPRGFLAFCERSSEECPQAPLLVRVPFLPGATPFKASSGLFFRADADPSVNAEPLDVSAGHVQPASRSPMMSRRFGAARGADWSGLFAAARLERMAVTPTEPAPDMVAGPAVRMNLTPEAWSAMGRVNKQVNKAIIFRDDATTWGTNDYWALPLEQGLRSGDCEDYVLEKRRALQAEGFPKEALSIALVITPWGESHAVLLVATQKGEMVLDNLSPWIVPWTETGYRWLTRQAPGGDAMRWVSIASAGA